MGTTIYDLKSFYDCKKGRLIQPLLMQHVRAIWPDCAGMRVLGIGYTPPYLNEYIDHAERVVAMMPAGLGVTPWAPVAGNMACLGDEAELPFETESIDRILVVHGLEFAEAEGPCLNEIWRVLKSTGRVIFIVPNRRGLWARAEWSPFGHGVPYSATQLTGVLRQHLFVIETVRRALLIPPLKSSFLMRSLIPLERFVSAFLRGLSGVVVIEAAKQIYSGTLVHNTSRAALRGRRVLMPTPAVGSSRVRRDGSF
jgi:SAM-dependent methyltransferase